MPIIPALGSVLASGNRSSHRSRLDQGDRAMEELPSGTVTLLFTDVEGSTLLVQELGAAYQYALDGHRQILRDAVASHAGREVDCRADELLACFPRASDGLAAAIAAQLALTSQDSQLRVRMGLHTGEPELIGDAYIGIDVNRAARICSAGHGGQILVSRPPAIWCRRASSSAISAPICWRGRAGRADLRGARRRSATSSLPLRAEHDIGGPGRRRRGLRPRRAPASSQLTDTAWRARKLVEPGPLREALKELAAALFDADRAVHRAEALLGRSTATASPAGWPSSASCRWCLPGGGVGRGTDAKLPASTDWRRPPSCPDLGAEAAALLGRSFTAHAVEQVRERLNLATGTLDGQITVTSHAHDALSYRLTRTRWRGIYRLDGLYVVPHHDRLGISASPSSPTPVRHDASATQSSWPSRVTKSTWASTGGAGLAPMQDSRNVPPTATARRADSERRVHGYGWCSGRRHGSLGALQWDRGIKSSAAWIEPRSATR